MAEKESLESKSWSWDNIFSKQGGGYTLLGMNGGVGANAGGLAGGGYFVQGASELMGVFSTAIQSGAMASAYRAQADLAARDAQFQGRFASEDYARQGRTAVKNIGIVQQQGLDAATLRYNALGAEIARQRVAASGSGIDLSSRTVGKAEQTSRRNAAWDVSHISQNTKMAADNYNEQAEAAFRNSAFATINADYQGQMSKIQGDLNADLAEISGKFGMLKYGINAGIHMTEGAFLAGMA